MRYKSFIVASFVAFLVCSTVFAQSFIIGKVTKNANLRAGPGTDYAVVGTVAAGQTIRVLGKDNTGKWYRLDNGYWIANFLVHVLGTATPSTTALATKSTQTPSPTYTALPTPNAKPTQKPTITPTPLPEHFILDVPSLIGKSIPQVDKVLGKPSDIVLFKAGDSAFYAGAGEWRDYLVSKYWIYATFDKQGKLHGITIEGGLVDDGYVLDEWKTVLLLVGIHTVKEPDKTALAGRRWNNLEGYEVAMFADGINSDSHIDMIQISISQ